MENKIKTPPQPKPIPEPIPVPPKKIPVHVEKKSMNETKPVPIIPDTSAPTASSSKEPDDTIQTLIAAKGPTYPAPRAPLIEAIPIYKENPPPPAFSQEVQAWMQELLKN